MKLVGSVLRGGASLYVNLPELTGGCTHMYPMLLCHTRKSNKFGLYLFEHLGRYPTISDSTAPWKSPSLVVSLHPLHLVASGENRSGRPMYRYLSMATTIHHCLACSFLKGRLSCQLRCFYHPRPSMYGIYAYIDPGK